MSKNVPITKLPTIIHMDYRFSDFALDNYVHRHNTTEFVYCICGQGSVTVENRSQSFDSHSLIVFPAYQSHEIQIAPETTFKRVVIHIDFLLMIHYLTNKDFEETSRLFRGLSSLQQNVFPVQAFHEQLDALVESCLSYEGALKNAYQVNKQLEIILFLIDLLRKECKFNDSMEDDSLVLFDDIRFYIARNLREVTVNNIIDVFHINEKQLYRLFKRYTGDGVNKFIKHEKLVEAYYLLHLNKDVQQVYHELGFQNYFTLNHMIKSLTYLSPSQFKKYWPEIQK